MNDPVELDDMYFVAPQIHVEDLAMLKKMGFERVINNRPDFEVEGQPLSSILSAEANVLGLEYIDNPIDLSVLGQEQLSIQSSVLVPLKKTFAFCRTGTRSSVLWVLLKNAQGDSYQDLVDYVFDKGFDLARCKPAMLPFIK